MDRQGSRSCTASTAAFAPSTTCEPIAPATSLTRWTGDFDARLRPPPPPPPPPERLLERPPALPRDPPLRDDPPRDDLLDEPRDLLDDLPDERPRDDEARELFLELRALPDFLLLPDRFLLPPLDPERPLRLLPDFLLLPPPRFDDEPPLLREPPREDLDFVAIELCSSV